METKKFNIKPITKPVYKRYQGEKSPSFYKDFSKESIEEIRSRKSLPNPLRIAATYGFTSIGELEKSIIKNKDMKREWDLYKITYKADLFEYAKENRMKDIIIKMAENDLKVLDASGTIPDINIEIDKGTFK